MLLPPVVPDDVPALDDAQAARPAGVPSGAEFDAAIDALQQRLAALQQVFWADGRRALLVVLQGRDAAGKDGAIRRVFGAVDPQGCVVTAFKVPSSLERRHDFLWRVHAAVPPLGTIGIFNRSHYEDLVAVRVRGLVPREVWERRFAQVNAFEALLASEGVVVLKFLLHVSRAEQTERLLARLDEPDKNWKFAAGDLEDRQHWDAYTEAYRDVLRHCSTPAAPWFVVPADSKKARDFLLLHRVVDALERLDLRHPSVDPALVAEWKAALRAAGG